VLVWRELADFSGYDEKRGWTKLSRNVHHSRASKSPGAIDDRDGALSVSLLFQIDFVVAAAAAIKLRGS
jgi:hypothetical protein